MQPGHPENAASTATVVLSMKLGFICPNTPGHLNPLTALARNLQARNHDVVFLYSSAAAGLPVVPGPEKDIVNENLPEVSKMDGDEAVEFAVRVLLSQTETILESLPAIVQANGVDALVIDTIQFYAELGAMRLGMPYIHVSAAMYLDYMGYTPLSLYGWPHQTTPAALARNREAVAKFVKLLEGANEGIRAYAKTVGLKIDWEDPGSTLSPLASITQVPEAFDFENSHWPSQFHHTGPFHDGKGREDVGFPWERLTGEPLIYASMGTILNGRVDVFRTIVAALAKHKDLQLVLSVGDQVDPEQIGPAPNNAIIVKRAPQLKLLKHASVCVTHAGLNTVLESLAQGVPQIAIPVAFDQPGVAARIANKQTGVVTSLGKLTAKHLSKLLNEVLTNTTYRDNARQLQKAITEAKGLSMAADLIDESLGVTEQAAKGIDGGDWKVRDR
jgi:zeaxanthin glucosyltransferase